MVIAHFISIIKVTKLGLEDQLMPVAAVCFILTMHGLVTRSWSVLLHHLIYVCPTDILCDKKKYNTINAFN